MSIFSLHYYCSRLTSFFFYFIQLAAKLESDWASLAIANMMPDAATVQLAIRYAGRLRRQNLAHRLAGVALEKERRVSETVEVDDWDDIPQSSTFRGKCNRYIYSSICYYFWLLF